MHDREELLRLITQLEAQAELVTDAIGARSLFGDATSLRNRVQLHSREDFRLEAGDAAVADGAGGASASVHEAFELGTILSPQTGDSHVVAKRVLSPAKGGATWTYRCGKGNR